MYIGRTLPPAAAPIPLRTILRAFSTGLTIANQDAGEFEKALKQYFGSTHCFLLSSGKAALWLILTALKELYPGRNEVLIPAFNCYSVPAAINKAGLQIKLCDLAPSSLDFNQEQLKAIISANRNKQKILCVLATHLFGCPADLTAIQTIVGPDIPVVEDAAQATGEKLDGQQLGTIGDVGFFSLGRGKSLSTVEGGIIITSRDDLAKKVASVLDNLPEYSKRAIIQLAFKALVTSILQYPSLFWLPKSLPFLRLGETIYDENFSLYKISSFQRKLAWNWQKRLDRHRKARMINLERWRDRLPHNRILACQKKLVGGSMIRFPLLARNSEERNHLVFNKQGSLGIMPGYPTPINEIPKIKQQFTGQQYPNAQDICNRLFTIPVHELLNDDDNKKLFSLMKRVGYI